MSTTRANVDALAAGARTGSYVLPKPGRPVGELLLSDQIGSVPRLREAEVASSIGQRTSALLDCQEQFLAELRGGLEELESDLGDATRARLCGLVHQAVSVLDWCDAVQADLTSESRLAARGLQPIDLTSFLSELARVSAEAGVTVRILGSCERPWWGACPLLGEVMARAVELVCARAGHCDSAVIEIREGREETTLRVTGIGQPGAEIPPSLVDSFRQSAARLGATVTPDELGPGSAGLVLQLPVVS